VNSAQAVVLRYRHRLRRWNSLRWDRRLLLFEAVVALAIARVAILVLPFRHLARLGERSPSAAARKLDAINIARIGGAMDMAARAVPWRAVCLPRAVAARLMLTRRGCDSVLHFGVGKSEDGTLNAHAWLEADGTVVVGGAAAGSVAHLARFGRALAGEVAPAAAHDEPRVHEGEVDRFQRHFVN
jgi:Transglutaminase-like superfamily